MRKNILPILVICSLSLFSAAVAAQSCDGALAQRDLTTNNVRARLLTGGDLWWDGSSGRYIVPKVPPGTPEVSALFAGALWLGGVDQAGNLKVAAQTYGRATGRADYWPGPLDPALGNTNENNCNNWDRFFNVRRDDIDGHIADFADNGQIDNPIPASLRGWPGRGNPLFPDVQGFSLPNTNQFLAPFFDRDGDGIYDPRQGDYPDVKGDEATWWVYNDNGNIHSQSNGAPLKMEIQATAFAYTGGVGYLNNTTFYEYRLIYRGTAPVDSFFLGLWIDPDLGCYSDDYVGCRPEDLLGFAYNGDAFDQDCSGVNGYGNEIPIVGIKVLKPLERPNGQDAAPLSSFMYYLNAAIGGPPAGATDPNNLLEYYRYLTGHWRDGSSLARGGNGYQPGGAPYPYAFDGSLVNGQPWTECNANTAPSDRRFLMNFGPLTLQPGEIREFAFAVVWVPNQAYPCPGLSALEAEAEAVENFYKSLLVSTQEISAQPSAEVRLSPNPMRESVLLQANAPIREVYLFSAQGQLLQAHTGLDTPGFTLRRQGLAAGVYFYRVVLEGSAVASGRLVVW